MSFICDFCQKTFTAEVYLDRHLKLAVCTKKYICNKCGKEFSTAHNLRTHLKKKTPCVPNEIPVIDLTQDDNKCHFCGKCYTTPYNLKRHILICPMKDNQMVLMQMLLKEQEIAELKEQNKLLKELNNPLIQVTNNNNNNNITNNNTLNVQNNMYVNVAMSGFGDEDLSKLETAEVMNLFKNHVEDFMPRMIEHVHANYKLPEFHNVFYDSEREKAIIFTRISDTEMSWLVRGFREVTNSITEKIKKYIRPGASPYFDIAMQDKDYDTSNNIIRIANEIDWQTKEFDEMIKINLTKITQNEDFRKLVTIKDDK